MHHDGGTTTVAVNQKGSHSVWVSLGSYDLTPGAAKVVLSNQANNYVIADAVRFVRSNTGTAEVVIDNTDPGASTVGSWSNSVSHPGHHGTNYVFRPAGTGANSFIWQAAVPVAGRYKVYAKWMGYAALSTDAKYTVHHGGGTTLVTFDQNLNKVMWNLLGAYEFDPAAGHKVVLSDDADGYTVADAVRYVPVTGVPYVQADAVKFVPNLAEDALYVHTDHLGTPRKMSDPTGAVVWDAALTPFGGEDSIAGTQILGLRDTLLAELSYVKQLVCRKILLFERQRVFL